MKKLLYSFVFIYLLAFPSFLSAQHWQKITNIPSPYDDNYWLDVFFLPANTNYGWICGFEGAVARTTDGGNTWRATTIPNADHMEHIHFPTRTTGYCSGIDGIFKSTDGGASWSDVSPSQLSGYWGCFFITENDGVVLHDGCDSTQQFWRTTDGGTTWNLFEGTEPNSGLTDAMILQQNGLGYASSSGKIWRTTDGGSTWSVFATTGANYWQEEITNLNQSFLVPVAGENCLGAGWGGGMRFSTNNGASWERFVTPASMFGSFLISEREGWACGYNGQCYYTSNAGISWDLMNCGLDSLHLDDIWFINRNEGWVVGQGVYRLAPAKHTFSKDTLQFGEICVPGIKYDTLYIGNRNFEIAHCHWELAGRDAASYQVLLTNQDINLSACGSTAIPVRVNVTSMGLKYALLKITIDGSRTYEIKLLTYGVKSTISPRDTLLIIKPAYCNQKNESAIGWDAQNDYDERIVALQPVSGSPEIIISSLIPARVQTKFTAAPLDTGWISTRFKAQMEPCAKDTFITVKAYGVSPIINSIKDLTAHTDCLPEFFDKIPVYNTGNDTLIIPSASFVVGAEQFSVIGWISGSSFPVRIPPGKSDTLKIRFNPASSGGYIGRLQIINNDSTKARGNMNPYEITIAATFAETILSSDKKEIDFGEVCVGNISTKTLKINNSGDLTAKIMRANHTLPCFKTTRDFSINPQSIAGDNSIDIAIEFVPNQAGIFRDTIIFVSDPCGDTVLLYVRGKGIDANLTAEPDRIEEYIQTYTTYKQTVTVTASGTEEITITQIELVPYNIDWTWKFTPTLPVKLLPGESKDFEFEFYTEKDGYLKTQICFKAEGKCPLELCADVELYSQSRVISVNPDVIVFPFQKCDNITLYDSLTIKNKGLVADTIVKFEIEPAGSAFSLPNLPPLPIIIQKDDSLKVAVSFTAPNEGSFSADLIIETIKPPGQSFSIPIRAEYRTVRTVPEYKSLDYGNIEICDIARLDTIMYKNLATYPDTLDITRSENYTGYKISPDKILIVPPNDSTRVIITMTPPDFPSIGEYKESFTLKSRVCPTEKTIEAEVNIIRPRLTVVPETINLGNIWIESEKSDTIVVYNFSGYTKRISGVSTKPADGVFIFKIELPKILNDGDSLKIPVVFNSNSEGKFVAEFLIYEESVCLDTSTVNLTANVPREEYRVKIRMGRYETAPGEFVTAAVILEDPVPRVKPDSIHYVISFDKWLFNPVEVKVRDTSGIAGELPLNYSNGTIRGSIPFEFSENLLQENGEILFIKGLALASMPDSTPLIITEFTPFSRKTLNFDKENGLLRIANFCKPIGSWRIRLLPTATLTKSSPAIEGDVLTLELNSTGSQTLRIQINNLLGSQLITKSYNVGYGEQELDIDISGLPSGTYMITVISQLDRYWRDKFIKVE